jgi:hypothetical protein
VSEDEDVAALQAELAGNARARIKLILSKQEDGDECQALEARAVELRQAIRAARSQRQEFEIELGLRLFQ